MIWAILAAIAITIALIPCFGATDFHFHKGHLEEKINVACVGDSITNGALIPFCFWRSYPANLQKLLGDKFHVENFGLNGRTLQSTGDIPYIKENEYKRSLEFLPDIVVMILGTNDTRAVNWKSESEFKEEYRKLLDTYINLEKKPEIILGTPPWQRNATKFYEKYTNDTFEEILPYICKAVTEIGEEYALPVVNLHEPFFERNDLVSYDGVHPNSKGAKLIAEHIYKSIKETIKK